MQPETSEQGTVMDDFHATEIIKSIAAMRSELSDKMDSMKAELVADIKAISSRQSEMDKEAAERAVEMRQLSESRIRQGERLGSIEDRITKAEAVQTACRAAAAAKESAEEKAAGQQKARGEWMSKIPGLIASGIAIIGAIIAVAIATINGGHE